MQVYATAKHLRISPRKARLMINQVRGLGVAEARRVLEVTDKKAAEMIVSVLNSAVANATHNNKLDTATLTVSTAVVNEGFTIKRYRARAFGRAAKIRKRTSHITIGVEGTVAEEKPAKKAATKEPAKTPAATKKPAAKKATGTKKAAAKKPAAKATTTKK